MEHSSCMQPTMMLGRVTGLSYHVGDLYLSLNLSKTKFNCLKPKLRSGVPEPTVRILGMIDKFQSKVISLIINHMGRLKMKILGQNFL